MQRRAIILFLLVAMAGSHCVAETPRTGKLRGTFLQLSERYQGWGESDWRELFAAFSRLGLERLVVQWSLHDELAYYPSRHFRAIADPPLETLLKLADEARMEVLVGLGHDTAFWRQIRRDPELVEVYLRRLRLRSLAAAEELLPVVTGHASFKGWYLPEEIDDVHWLEAESRRILVLHLRETADALRELTPEGRIAVSGFTNAQADPATLEAFWSEILTPTAVDLVLFQDGIGVGKLELDELPLYLAAVRRAVLAAGRELAVVVEVFEQTGGPAIDGEPFRAVPAGVERVRRQIELAAEYSSAEPVAFSVPEYMTPLGGDAAGKLMEALLAGR